MPLPTAVILVSAGFGRRTGYYHRCIQDQADLRSLGFQCEIVPTWGTALWPGRTQRPRITDTVRQVRSADVVVIENYGALAWYGLLSSVGCRSDQKTLFVVHGSLAELAEFRLAPSKHRVYSRVERRLVPRMTGVLCVSEVMANQFRARFPEITSRCHVTPNLPPAAFYERVAMARRRPREELRTELCLPVGSRILLYAGNHQPWQNLPVLTAVAREITARSQDFQIVGLSPDAQRLAESLREGGVPESRTTVAAVQRSEVPDYLVAADWLWLVRGLSEINRVACPTKGVEYLISGRSLVISDELGDLTSLVRERGRGIVLDRGREDNPSFIAERILASTDSDPLPAVGENPWGQLPARFAPGGNREVLALAMGHGLDRGAQPEAVSEPEQRPAPHIRPPTSP